MRSLQFLSRGEDGRLAHSSHVQLQIFKLDARKPENAVAGITLSPVLPALAAALPAGGAQGRQSTSATCWMPLDTQDSGGQEQQAGWAAGRLDPPSANTSPHCPASSSRGGRTSPGDPGPPSRNLGFWKKAGFTYQRPQDPQGPGQALGGEEQEALLAAARASDFQGRARVCCQGEAPLQAPPAARQPGGAQPGQAAARESCPGRSVPSLRVTLGPLAWEERGQFSQIFSRKSRNPGAYVKSLMFKCLL